MNRRRFPHSTPLKVSSLTYPSNSSSGKFRTSISGAYASLEDYGIPNRKVNMVRPSLFEMSNEAGFNPTFLVDHASKDSAKKRNVPLAERSGLRVQKPFTRLHELLERIRFLRTIDSRFPLRRFTEV